MLRKSMSTIYDGIKILSPYFHHRRRTPLAKKEIALDSVCSYRS